MKQLSARLYKYRVTIAWSWTGYKIRDEVGAKTCTFTPIMGLIHSRGLQTNVPWTGLSFILGPLIMLVSWV